MTPRDFIPISEAVARVVGRVMRRQREMADEAAKPDLGAGAVMIDLRHGDMRDLPLFAEAAE